MNIPQLSIIIPTLDEAATLPALLDDLRRQQGVTFEIIVSDGGSRDDTATAAVAAGAIVVVGPRGRARQMNAGAAQARGAWLLFLHADSRLPTPALLADAVASLHTARHGQQALAGHFGLQFIGGHPLRARFYDWLAYKTRSGRHYSINGDQGVLIARTDFEALGRYDERRPFLEDQELARRIRRAGGWLLLPGTLHTSARRFEREGAGARYVLMAMMMGAWAADFEAFFEQAPALYAAQGDAAALDPHPYARLGRRLLRAQGRDGVRTLLRIGRFVRENAWQLAAYRDWRDGHADQRWLRRFDRWIAGPLDNRLADGLAALLVAGWLWIWLPLSARCHR